MSTLVWLVRLCDHSFRPFGGALRCLSRDRLPCLFNKSLTFKFVRAFFSGTISRQEGEGAFQEHGSTWTKVLPTLCSRPGLHVQFSCGIRRHALPVEECRVKQARARRPKQRMSTNHNPDPRLLPHFVRAHYTAGEVRAYSTPRIFPPSHWSVLQVLTHPVQVSFPSG